MSGRTSLGVDAPKIPGSFGGPKDMDWMLDEGQFSMQSSAVVSYVRSVDCDQEV
jgi:hypothetical protein